LDNNLRTILRFATIITNDGITIFHKSFVEEELDEYLFSGFSSAMIAFSKELGDELTAIKMGHQTIIYREIGEGTLILSLKNGFDEEIADTKMEVLATSEIVETIIEGSKIGILQNTNEELERELVALFDVPVIPAYIIEEEQKEESDLFMEALEELKSFE
jgi:hypothetical protein